MRQAKSVDCQRLLAIFEPVTVFEPLDGVSDDPLVPRPPGHPKSLVLIKCHGRIVLGNAQSTPSIKDALALLGHNRIGSGDHPFPFLD